MKSRAGTCVAGPREQLNQLTSWLDASHVYGSKKDEAFLQRERGNKREEILCISNFLSLFF